MPATPLASTSVRQHYVRGALGLAALAVGVAGAAAGQPAALALLIVTVGIWRGCPTCWAVGLVQTRERERRAAARCRSCAAIVAGE